MKEQNANQIWNEVHTKEENPIYIALEEANFVWSKTEVSEFSRLWKQGKTIHELCKHFGRCQVEIALLILDRADKGYIKARENGIF